METLLLVAGYCTTSRHGDGLLALSSALPSVCFCECAEN